MQKEHFKALQYILFKLQNNICLDTFMKSDRLLTYLGADKQINYRHFECLIFLEKGRFCLLEQLSIISNIFYFANLFTILHLL